MPYEILVDQSCLLEMKRHELVLISPESKELKPALHLFHASKLTCPLVFTQTIQKAAKTGFLFAES